MNSLREVHKNIPLVAIIALLIGCWQLIMPFFRPQPVPITLQPPPTWTPTPSPTATATPAPVAVFISGAVSKPGLLTLPANSRIVDAINAAGGFTDQADIAALNLADWVQDAMQIHVPSIAEQAPTPAPGVSMAPTKVAPDAPKTTTQVGALININTATAAQLETLPGIGPSKAQAIIASRPYATVADLTSAKGIGEKTLDSLRSQIATE